MTSIEIIPGEMRWWTDRANPLRRPAGGAVFRELLGAVLGDPSVGRRVLVVGPHDDKVLGWFEDRETTVLVRSLSDAEQISAADPRVAVVCGDLDQFATTVRAPWDLVVALDGVGRLASNDFATTAWSARTASLSRLVADDGVLLVSVDNPLSLVDLADARPAAERRDEGDWEPPASVDGTRPASAAHAGAAFSGSGLSGVCYAASWLPTQPGVLVEVGTRADDVRLRSALGRDVLALADHELLFDPTAAALATLRAGRFADAASGWVLVLRRGTSLPALPTAILADGGNRATTFDTAAWATVPPGDLVVEAALRLVQTEDLAALRDLVAGYLAWVADMGIGYAADEVLLADGSFEVLGQPAPLPGDAVATAALWLARRLLATDVRRVWPPWLDDNGVGRALTAMAGIATDAARFEEAGAGARPHAVSHDLSSLRALNAQLLLDIEAARGQVTAHERLAAHRDRQLERRSNQLRDAELRATRAESRSTGGGVAVRRIVRGVLHPVNAARAVRRRLSRS